MPDYARILQEKLDKYNKEHPDREGRFIDSHPDVLRDRLNDGWLVHKEGNLATAGTVGEVRVGDLILASKTRKEVEEDRKRQEQRTSDQLHAPVNRFETELGQLGGSGRYIKPMSPG